MNSRPQDKEAEKDAEVESLIQQAAALKEEHKRVKAQLAKESFKLQHFTDRRTIEQSLLNQNASNIDRMFSCMNGTGTSNDLCKHELCNRAKTTGISWTELDTVKWYDMRIRQEKTQRMRIALAKQREVELARIKQSEDEDEAVRARKKAKKRKARPEERSEALKSTKLEGFDSQDVETVIFRTRMALMHTHKYSALVHAQQRNDADMERCADELSMLQLQKSQQDSNYENLVEQLNQKETRMASLVEEAAWYTDKIAEAIQTSSRHKQSTVWRDFDLDFDSSDPDMIELCGHLGGLMKKLGMDTVYDVEHAQAALRRCMSLPRDQIPQPIRKTIDYIQRVIVKAQKQFRSKQSPLPDASDTIVPNCVSLLGELRTSLCHLLAPQALQGSLDDPSTVYSNLLDIESEALSRIYEEYDRIWLEPPNEVVLSLKKLTAKYVTKSTMPQLTEPMLDIITSSFIDMSSARSIIEDLGDITDQELVARLSGMVFARAEKKSDWLMEAVDEIEATFETVNCQRLPERIVDALGRVRASVEDRLRSISHRATISKLEQNDPLESDPGILEAQSTSTMPSHKVPTVLITRVMPARRKLLPRGDRHQNQLETLRTAVAAAYMNPETAKRMSDFCILEKKVYERAGLAVPVDVLDRMKITREIANAEPKAKYLAQNSIVCQCNDCVVTGDSLGNKKTNCLGITIDGHSVTDDEFLCYTGATMERIHSISRGEAKLEYLCWIAYKVGLEADAATSLEIDWRLPFRRFEEFFTYYAPIPHELKLALDHAKGKLWRSCDCLKTHPIDDWPLIDNILTITENIRAKKLSFTTEDGAWRIPNTGKDAGHVLRATSVASDDLDKMELEKEERQTAAIQTQIDAIRQLEGPPESANASTTQEPTEIPVTRESLLNLFTTYDMSVRAVTDCLPQLTQEAYGNDGDPKIEIACRIQLQCFDSVRMLQLTAENRGWTNVAEQMGQCLADCGYVEDEDGHFPDFWGNDDDDDDNDGDDDDGDGDDDDDDDSDDGDDGDDGDDHDDDDGNDDEGGGEEEEGKEEEGEEEEVDVSAVALPLSLPDELAE